MKPATNVLILRSNPVFPDPRVEKIGAALLKQRYNVSVLCWDRDAKYLKREIIKELFVERLQIKAKYGSGLQNFPALIRWQVMLLLTLIRKHHQYDILHACDFDTIFPAFLCGFFFKKIIVYDIFDFYSEHLRKTPKLIKEIIRKIDLFLIGHVDAVILVDEKRIEQITGSKPKKIEFIYNSPIDTYHLTQEKADEHGRQPFTIVYVGLLQMERGIESLIYLLKNNPQWQLIMAGFGGDGEVIAKNIKDVKNIIFYGRIQYEKALELTASADLVWAIYDPIIPNHRYASPNKLFEALMLGKPIIVANCTNIDGVVQDLDCGIVVEYGNNQNIQQTIDLLYKNPDIWVMKGKNARLAYEKYYSWNIMEKRLADLYSALVEKKA